MKLFLLVLALLTISACGDSVGKPQPIADPNSAAQVYLGMSEQLLSELRLQGRAPELEHISTALAVAMYAQIPDLRVRFPECDAYLKRLYQGFDSSVQLTYAELSEQYRNGDALPNFEAPICYHIKEATVLPLLIRAIVRESQTGAVNTVSARRYALKAQAHFNIVQQQLQRK